MNKKLIVILVVLFIGNIFCLAQDASENSKPTGLTIEITYHKENKPAYLAVPETDDEKVKSAWFSHFERVPNWQLPAGSLPVRAVNFVSRCEGDAVKVDISVITGQKLHEKEESVAALTMRENDKIIVKELLKFGVEPFELSVVRVTPSVTVLPSVNNKSRSLTVASLEPNYSTLPSYKLMLANNSGKAVSALTFNVTVNGFFILSGMPQGDDGNPLIEPGGVFEKMIPNASKPNRLSEGQIVPVVPNQVITISAVVFEDGTYEGDQLEAARFLAFTLGRKLQIKRIIDLLKQVGGKEFDLAEINRQANDLSIATDETEFDKFTGKFPNLSDKEISQLRTSVEVALQGTKRRFLDEIGVSLNEISETKPSRNWFAVNLERYSNWLARLD